MADAKITELTELTTIADDDLFVVVDDSEIPKTTKRILWSNLKPKFGSEFSQSVSEGTSSTALTTFQEKLKHTTASLPSGNYIIQWQYEVRNTDNDRSHFSRVQLNDSTALEDSDGAHKQDSGTAWIKKSGFYYAASISGVQTIDIDYRSGGVGSAEIRKARIMVFRQA